MKKIIFALFVLSVVNLLAGCSVWSQWFPKNVQQDVVTPVPEEKPFTGEPLVKALVQYDAKAFLSLMPQEIREEYGEAGFKKSYDSMLQVLGKPIKYEWLFNLEHPSYTVSIWKIRYQRRSSDQSKMIFQESLFKVVSMKNKNGEDVILQFNFL